MDKKTKLKYLKAARKKIENPENWCRRRYAEARGIDLQYGCSPKSHDATAWCAVGAIAATTSGLESEMILDNLKLFLPKEFKCVALFNDSPDTKHEDVLALYDRAIEVAKKE